MQRGNDGRAALAVESAQKLEDLDLMLEIEKRRGFVKQKEFWSLCQRESNLDTLALTTAQLIEATTGQMLYTCEFHRSTYFDPGSFW